LWQALGARRGDAPYAQAHARLSAWRERADFVPPFAFFAQVLGADGGRRRMLERLGPEAADALEAFLNLALEFEHSGPPGLQNFTRWMRDQRAEVRRDMDEGAGEVRIMTVHGAKGLEAPVVILPDTCDTPSLRHAPILNRLDTETELDVGGARPSPVAFSPGKKDQAPTLVEEARERYLAAQMEEYRRLLYVAMTRARDRLYVAGYRSGKGDLAEGCWYRLIEAALDGEAKQVTRDDGTAVRRYRHGATAEAAEAPAAPAPAPPAARPDWLAQAAPHPEPLPATLSPSRLADADAATQYGQESGEEGALARQEAIARGNLIHHLLQYLPQMPNRADGEELARMADRLARSFAPQMADEARAAATAEAVRLLADPSSAFLFADNGRAELTLAGRLRDRHGANVEVSGQIDRLIVTDREVVIVDYKSNRQVPARAEEAPAAYLAQLSAYRRLLARIYPDKAIRAVLVWTAGPAVMEVSAALLDSHDHFI
jgi:ATP-dependent helicase/nuclease subunit A